MLKMKVLIVTGGYFPGQKYGGPPVSVNNFCTLLKNDIECYIITHNHDMGESTPYPNITEGWNEHGEAKIKYVSDKEFNSHVFEATIQEVQPNYIYLQGLFQECVLPCLRLAKKHHLKVVLAPRGELCAGAFTKKYKKIPYIAVLRMMGLLDNVVFQSTSDEETIAIGKYLGASEDRIRMLTNIPSIPQNLPARKAKEVGEGRFVFVSRILSKKNLLRAIKLFDGVKGKVVFDIYGPKEDENYWNECEKAIKELASNIEVTYKGVVNHDEIHATFSKYDSFLFPTFSENYGHVIAEALFAGCVPIISDQTPWTDINDSKAGWAIPLGDENLFLKAIQQIVEMDEDAIQTIKVSIKEYLNKKLKLDELKKEYMAVFK